MNTNNHYAIRSAIFLSALCAALSLSGLAFGQLPETPLTAAQDATPSSPEAPDPVTVDNTPAPESPQPSPAESADSSIPESDDDTLRELQIPSALANHISRAFLTTDAQEVFIPDSSLTNALGFSPDLKADDNTLGRILELAQDDVLRDLLNHYEEFLRTRRTSNDTPQSEIVESIFQSTRRTPEEKIALFQTLTPFFTRYAMASRDLTALRKLREISHSVHRIWPELHYDIACRTAQHAIRFPLSALTPGTTLTAEMISDSDFSSAMTSEPECTVFTATNTQNLSADFSEALHDAIFALLSKDNDLTANAMGRLSTLLDTFHAKYGYIASWNRHWDNAPIEKWLCQLQIIMLSALDQNRFPELSRLERSIQNAFSGSSFYTRLREFQSCSKNMNGDFAQAAEQLNTDHASSYKWIVEQFSPKNIKKIDKSFAAWNKKGTKPVKFYRHLLAAWTAWSLGDYKKAASFAGDVTEGRSRIVHPQLHSFDVMLKAVQGEEISQESLETYVRVIRLKSPALVYQTMAESAPWWNTTMRKRIVDVMTQYDPGIAASEAALFYLAYEPELRARMNAAHRAANDAWLETELRSRESAVQTNTRRLQWLDDLAEAESWSAIDSLAAIAASDSDMPFYTSFWHEVSRQVHAVLTNEIPEPVSLWTKFDDCQTLNYGNESPKAWLKTAKSCMDQ